MGRTTTGVVFATVTAVIWGGQFVVGKSALARVDAFPLTAIRYAIAAALLLALLRPSRGAVRCGSTGQGWRLFGLGSLGFAGFNLFAYTGLEHARPQSAVADRRARPAGHRDRALVARRHTPARTTAIALVVALVGVALVVSERPPGDDRRRLRRLGRRARARSA